MEHPGDQTRIDCARRLAGKELRDDLFLEGREGFRVAEEIGDADQEVPEERLHLRRVLLQVAHIPVQPVDLVDGHAPLHAADHGVLLVEGKVMARLGAQEDTDLFQGVFRLGGRGRDRAGPFAEGVGDVGDELGRHLGRRQDVVHQARGDGAPRHAVVLRGFGVLRHDHAPLALDRPDTLRAVAAGAGQHDADGPLALVLGEGTEEKVDGQTHAAGSGLFQQLQRAVQEGHVPVGRDDVGAVGLDRHPVLDLVNLHPRIAPDQVGEDALVVRGQVLHQDKGHAGIGVGGHAGKERLEGRQPPGGGADADDGEALPARC